MTDQHDVPANNASTPRKSYAQPKLEELGDVRELTRGPFGSVSDFSFTKKKKTG